MIHLTDYDIERIAVKVGVERIWHVVDRLTQPQLPSVAAEREPGQP